ncbi:lysine-specific demethylase REF6-like [Cynara cardunculus var. scolymus]|uniref:lysine-specific demethylase REF6-like n=1 Tax=Cynara cardunculus var. scolymus TaxID=59895 RepID=UPI000D624ACD|nr:lysine-specific demethylase REF6-like [Cynara cardunculus var. scolymus]
MADEVFPWLKSLPLAPEYHPTLTEFQDPIGYIFKIEDEASKYGICKIVPPVSASPKKTTIANLNQSLSAQNPDSSPTFTTRQQQIGFCPRRHRRPVHKSVWQSGETYTLPQFEAKAKNFEKNYMKKGSNSKKGFTALEMETLYWKAQMDKPFLIEYANDIPGSAFHQTGGGCGGKKQGIKEIGDGLTVGETGWNMREVSRAKGSLLKFVKEEIPGVTSPMVYMAMMFSWFAWHVEDHEFHSLNYMHMGAGKTWYGVPKDAAVVFEDVIRDHGYGGEINPILTFATLGEKTTVMSPDVLLKAGVPCCRLVQKAGEFVVTFPRAYHSGFSHGFNCAEAANIATPGWLRVARDAAIRRASVNSAPMVSHFQLLYDLAVSLSASVRTSIKPQPRSSRSKDMLMAEGEFLVKRLFLHDMMQNNELLHTLGKGSPIVVLHEDALYSSTSKDSCFGSQLNVSPMLPTRGLFSCVRCGILCYACVAIIQPTEATARYLMSVDCRAITDLVAATDVFAANEDANLVDLKPSSATGSPKVNSALDLLALAYGDHSDSESDIRVNYSSNVSLNISDDGTTTNYNGDRVDGRVKIGESSYRIANFVRSKCNRFFMESNCSMGRFEYQIQVPHSERKPSSNANESEALIIGKSITQAGNTQMNPTRDDDTSRMHIFCLQHAAEVEQCLRRIGGVRILLLCRQEYPKLETEARLVEKEFGTDHIWTDLEFKEATKHDKQMIQSALHKQEATHCNHDWAARLGLDLFHSCKLSRSPLYRKQMPYNSVICKAFVNGSPSSDPVSSKPSSKHKKITVVGKWCGKVWMSNEVHPLLVVRDVEHQERDKTDVSGFSRMDAKLEKRPEITQVVVIKNLRKRKRKNMTISKPMKFTTMQSSPPPPPSSPLGNLSLSGGFRRQRTRTLRTKKAVESEEGEFGCDIEGCIMSFDNRKDLMAHKKNVCPEKGCGKKLFSHKYLMQHKRVHMDDRPFKCPWKGCQVTFKWAWARTEHVRVHTGARPYTCTTEGCGRSFRFVSDFSRHKRKTGHFAKK